MIIKHIKKVLGLEIGWQKEISNIYNLQLIDLIIYYMYKRRLINIYILIMYRRIALHFVTSRGDVKSK